MEIVLAFVNMIMITIVTFGLFVLFFDSSRSTIRHTAHGCVRGPADTGCGVVITAHVEGRGGEK